MRTAILTLAVVLMSACLAYADHSLDRIIGDWVSPDGSARQLFEPGLDGSWLTSRMWFKDGEAWKLVSIGGLYRKPGEDGWTLASRAVDMDGMVLFESTLTPGEEMYHLRNRSYMEDGKTMETEEEWRFPEPGRIDYTIFKVTDSGREKWFTGTWIRSKN